MADIFISYASEDRDSARMFAEALGAQGWSVWWDREIPFGTSFDAVIEKALGEAKCLIVLWSAHAVESQWVRNEASDGEARGILVPVFIEAVRAPIAFRRLNGADLHDWQPGSPHPEFDRVLARVFELLSQSPRVDADAQVPAQLSRPGRHEPPRLTKYDSGPRISSWHVAAAAVVILGLLLGSYLLSGGRSTPSPASNIEQSGKAAAPTKPGTSSDSIRDPSANLPNPTQRGAGAARDERSSAAATVGQITLSWHGRNTVGWRVLAADGKTVLRRRQTLAQRSDSEDLSPGAYVVAFDLPAFQPVSVTVRAGHASPVIPAVGQLTLNWTGANSVLWQVLDPDSKIVLRRKQTLAKRSDSEDLPPGDYVVAFDLTGLQPILVTVRADQVSFVTR